MARMSTSRRGEPVAHALAECGSHPVDVDAGDTEGFRGGHAFDPTGALRRRPSPPGGSARPPRATARPVPWRAGDAPGSARTSSRRRAPARPRAPARAAAVTSARCSRARSSSTSCSGVTRRRLSCASSASTAIQLAATRMTMPVSRNHSSSAMKTAKVASSGFLPAPVSTSPPRSCSTVSAADPRSEPTHMRRHGIAAPERNRNSVASASVSITNDHEHRPGLQHQFDQTDSSPGRAASRASRRTTSCATVRMVATRRIVPKASPTRKSRVFSST